MGSHKTFLVDKYFDADITPQNMVSGRLKKTGRKEEDEVCYNSVTNSPRKDTEGSQSPGKNYNAMKKTFVKSPNRSLEPVERMTQTKMVIDRKKSFEEYEF
jgi:hypothetical protein